MALPTSRNTTYAAGSQILSADLNGLQDAVVSGSHGQIVTVFGAFSGAASGGTFGLVSARYGWTATAASQTLWIPIVLPAGSVIVSGLRVHNLRGGAVDVDMYLYETQSDGSRTQLATGTNSSASMDDTALTGGFGSWSMNSAKEYHVEVVSSQSGDYVGWVAVDHYK